MEGSLSGSSNSSSLSSTSTEKNGDLSLDSSKLCSGATYLSGREDNKTHCTVGGYENSFQQRIRIKGSKLGKCGGGNLLYSSEDVELEGKGGRVTIDTGISIHMPQGFRAMIAPLSGTGDDILDSAIRIIAPCTWTDVRVTLINNTSKMMKIKVGDSIAQLLTEDASSLRVRD